MLPSHRRRRAWSATLALVVGLLLAPAGPGAAAPPDQPWAELRAQSRQVLAALVDEHTAVASDGEAVSMRPRLVVVGFTGGLERENSRVSGVVRLRRRIEDHVGDAPGVVARAYSNFAWRRATDDVLALAAEGPPPVIVVYGHSWGGGAITKFARAVGEGGLDVALAIYIDAFTLRNPRVPGNVRYAMNIYQRTGLLRGLPLRGKSKLMAEAPERTTVLANLRVTPETEHFGWNWNLIQPIFYRHHHRIGHDLRIQRLLLDLVSLVAVPTEAPDGVWPFSAGDSDAQYD